MSDGKTTTDSAADSAAWPIDPAALSRIENPIRPDKPLTERQDTPSWRKNYGTPSADATTSLDTQRGRKNAALDRPEPDAVSCPVHGGGRSSMVEPQIVILVVAGSSPVGHPIF